MSVYKKMILSCLLICGFVSIPTVRAIEPLTVIFGIAIGGLYAKEVYVRVSEYMQNASFAQVQSDLKKLIDQGSQRNFYACYALSEAEYANWCDDHDQETRYNSFVMTEAKFILACKREFASHATPLLRAYEVLKAYWIECATLNEVLASNSKFYESQGLSVKESQSHLNSIINRVRRNLVVIENVLGIGAEEFQEKESDSIDGADLNTNTIGLGDSLHGENIFTVDDNSEN